MARTATAITAAGNLVRQAVSPNPGVGVSSDLELQLTVKASDLIALLTPAEKAQLAAPGAPQRLLFAVALTDDALVLLTDGTAAAYAEAVLMARTAPTDGQILQLARLLGYTKA